MGRRAKINHWFLRNFFLDIFTRKKVYLTCLLSLTLNLITKGVFSKLKEFTFQRANSFLLQNRKSLLTRKENIFDRFVSAVRVSISPDLGLTLTVLVSGNISGGGIGLGWYTFSPGLSLTGTVTLDTVCGLEVPSAVVGGAVTMPG